MLNAFVVGVPVAIASIVLAKLANLFASIGLTELDKSGLRRWALEFPCTCNLALFLLAVFVSMLMHFRLPFPKSKAQLVVP